MKTYSFLLVIIFFLLLIISNGMGQSAPDTLWTKTVGDSLDDSGIEVLQSTTNSA